MGIHFLRSRLGFILNVLLFLLVLATPSWAELKCGDTIGPGAVATLTKDLECLGPEPGLTLEGGSILNLGGHRIFCDGRDINGVEIRGGGSILQNGLILECLSGVVVGGSGGHIVTKVTAAENNFFGFRVIEGSHGNVLTYNRATETEEAGSGGGMVLELSLMTMNFGTTPAMTTKMMGTM